MACWVARIFQIEKKKNTLQLLLSHWAFKEMRKVYFCDSLVNTSRPGVSPDIHRHFTRGSFRAGVAESLSEGDDRLSAADRHGEIERNSNNKICGREGSLHWRMNKNEFKRVQTKSPSCSNLSHKIWLASNWKLTVISTFCNAKQMIRIYGADYCGREKAFTDLWFEYCLILGKPPPPGTSGKQQTELASDVDWMMLWH